MEGKVNNHYVHSLQEVLFIRTFTYKLVVWWFEIFEEINNIGFINLNLIPEIYYILVQLPNLKNLSCGLNLSRGLNMVGST